MIHIKEAIRQFYWQCQIWKFVTFSPPKSGNAQMGQNWPKMVQIGTRNGTYFILELFKKQNGPYSTQNDIKLKKNANRFLSRAFSTFSQDFVLIPWFWRHLGASKGQKSVIFNILLLFPLFFALYWLDINLPYFLNGL